jgi:hypothetical protein
MKENQEEKRLNPTPKVVDEVPGIVQSMRDTLTNILDSDGINAVNMLNIATQLMSVAGKYKKLTGLKKKELVVFVISEVIEEQVDDDVAKDVLQMMISTVIPPAIDLLVDVSKKRYKFNSKNWCC